MIRKKKKRERALKKEVENDRKTGACEMAWWPEAPAVKPGDPSSVPGTHVR